MKSKVKNGEYACDQCAYTTAFARGLTRHKTVMHGPGTAERKGHRRRSRDVSGPRPGNTARRDGLNMLIEGSIEQTWDQVIANVNALREAYAQSQTENKVLRDERDRLAKLVTQIKGFAETLGETTVAEKIAS